MVKARSVQKTVDVIDKEFLKSSPCFIGLDDYFLDRVSKLMTVRKVARHEIIWLENQPAESIYFIASGLIKLFKTSVNGKEQILKLVRPGDCFGHIGILTGGSNPESAQALLPSVLYRMTRTDFEAVMQKSERISFNTINTLAAEINHYISLVEDLSLRRVNGRLAKILLEHDGEEVCRASRVLTRSNLAAMTGTVREVVGKAVKYLELKGAIRASNSSIVIEDSNVLRKIASLV